MEAEMDYYQGERVRFLGKADWGPGWIEANSRDGKVRVRFLGAGKKLLHLKYAKLMKVKPIPPGSKSTRTTVPRA